MGTLKNNISIPEKAINLYISFTLNNCLLGSVELTKNADPDKYICSGDSIGFDSGTEFSFTDECVVKNVIIFGADLCMLITKIKVS